MHTGRKVVDVSLSFSEQEVSFRNPGLFHCFFTPYLVLKASQMRIFFPGSKRRSEKEMCKRLHRTSLKI